MADNKQTVFIVDDDVSVRKSLTMLLNSVEIDVRSFASAKEFLESKPNASSRGCLVLDVKMPGLSGLDLQKELSSRNISIPIIFITGHGDIPMSVQAMKRGAVNFLPKPFDDTQLIDSINEAFKKDSQIHTDLSEQNIIQQKLDTLTVREYEVLRYLIAGMLNKQIGYELNISERTIKAHRKQVLDKMGVHSIAELVRMTENVGVRPVDQNLNMNS